MNSDQLHILAEICGFIGGAIGITLGIPQLRRMRALRHTEGLELSPWILMCLSFASWVTFGILHSSPSVVIMNSLGFASAGLVVIGFLGRNAKAFAVLATLGAVAYLFVRFAPQYILDPVILALTANRLPQLIRTWMNRDRTEATAVSMSSLVVTLISFSFWMLYGVFGNVQLVIWNSIIGLTVSVLTAALELRIAHRVKIAQKTRTF